MSQKSPSAAPAEKMIRVKAKAREGHEWHHEGKLVEPGTVLELSEDRAARVIADGVADAVT